MPIFDSAIFDGPPSSTIFDTGASLSPARTDLKSAHIHGIQSSGAIHGNDATGGLHDKQSSGSIHNTDPSDGSIHDTESSARTS